jgi:hypothetical protein
MPPRTDMEVTNVFFILTLDEVRDQHQTPEGS